MTTDEVDCPYCGARAGEACRTWYRRPTREPHVDRLVELAVALERD